MYYIRVKFLRNSKIPKTKYAIWNKEITTRADSLVFYLELKVLTSVVLEQVLGRWGIG